MVFLVSFLLFNLIASRSVFATSYSIDRTDIEVFLQDDGSAK
jgi:hypothetical protein